MTVHIYLWTTCGYSSFLVFFLFVSFLFFVVSSCLCVFLSTFSKSCFHHPNIVSLLISQRSLLVFYTPVLNLLLSKDTTQLSFKNFFLLKIESTVSWIPYVPLFLLKKNFFLSSLLNRKYASMLNFASTYEITF